MKKRKVVELDVTVLDTFIITSASPGRAYITMQVAPIGKTISHVLGNVNSFSTTRLITINRKVLQLQIFTYKFEINHSVYSRYRCIFFNLYLHPWWGL